jgi:Protein of unknown function (DUF2490)
MQGFTRFRLQPMVALRLMPALLVASVVLHPALCGAQEVDAPARSNGSGSVFAPSGWLTLITPLQRRVDLKLTGFYIGELDVPVGQVDVSIRATKFLTITPSYMYYSAPASGLNELAPKPAGFTDSYDEHQFRIDGTLTYSVRKLELSARNMYVRRFRQGAADDINRYRGRLGIAYPVAVAGSVWKPCADYAAYSAGGGGGWDKHRVLSGVTLPVTKRVLFQPSYMYERSDGTKDVHYLLFGLMVRTR